MKINHLIFIQIFNTILKKTLKKQNKIKKIITYQPKNHKTISKNYHPNKNSFLKFPKKITNHQYSQI